MVFLTYGEAVGMLDDPFSCFELVKTSKHMILSPKYLNNVKNGICEQLEGEIKRYNDSMQGVLVAFNKNDIKLHQRAGTIMGSDPFIHLDIQTEFVVFRPKVGSMVKVVVNKMSREHIGGVVHGFFNMSVPKSSMRNMTVTDGQEVICQVTKIYSNAAVISLRGVFKSHSDVAFAAAAQGQKRKADDLDLSAIEASNTTIEDELPNLSNPKKRRKLHGHTLESSMDISTPGGMPFTSTPGPSGVGLVAGGDASILQDSDSSKKKKKKKKHIKEEEEENSVNESSVGEKRKGKHKKDRSVNENSKDVSDMSSDVTEDSGIAVTTPHIPILGQNVVDGGSGKKKKKKHKEKDIKTEPDSMSEADMSVSMDSSNVELSGSNKKKKHKKHKKNIKDEYE